MSRSAPPVTWFRAFEAAARHLSFTAAADELGMTQSAVSQQVKAMETRFDTALFTRKPRGLALTDAGRKLVPQVAQALQLAALGNGVALVSALLAREALASGALVRAHPGAIAAREGYFVAVREHSAAARAFRDWLTKGLR